MKMLITKDSSEMLEGDTFAELRATFFSAATVSRLRFAQKKASWKG